MYINIVTFLLQRKHPSIDLSRLKPSGTTATQPPLTSFACPDKKWSHTDPRQNKSSQCLMTLISAKLLLISFVLGPELRAFVSLLNACYTVPTRNTTQKQLIARSDLLKTKVNVLIGETDSVSITVDLWTNRQMRSYIGITMHVIVDYEMKSAMLACQRVKGRDTGENIAQHYEDVISTYPLNNTRITIVTDNASNMVKAFALPGFEIERVTDSDDDSEVESDDDDDAGNEHGDAMDQLPDHERCFAHSLQLVVKDGLTASTTCTNAIGLASAIVSHVRKSTVAIEHLEGELKLQAAVPTRWNSQVKMVRSVLAIPSDRLDTIEATRKLTSVDRDVLQEFVEIMTPFEEATDRTQGENIVTASCVIPVIRGLRHHLSCFAAQYNATLVRALQASLNRRLTAFEERVIYRRAAVLDPRFKLRWCVGRESGNVKADIIAQLPTTGGDTQPPPPKRPCLFSFMDEAADNTHDTNNETESYLNERCIPANANPLSYWRDNAHRLPGLALLARRFLNVTASSAPVERLFSTAGKIFRPDRARLTDRQFEILMYNKCNDHLL